MVRFYHHDGRYNSQTQIQMLMRLRLPRALVFHSILPVSFLDTQDPPERNRKA